MWKRALGWIVAHPMFSVSVLLCAIVAAWGIAAPDHLAATAGHVTGVAFGALDWFFIGSVTGFLVLIVWLALSRFGSLRLGKPGERPEFSTLSWLAMLFAAGMGVGLLFWGVAEPVLHYVDPPVPRGRPPARRATRW